MQAFFGHGLEGLTNQLLPRSTAPEIAAGIQDIEACLSTASISCAFIAMAGSKWFTLLSSPVVRFT